MRRYSRRTTLHAGETFVLRNVRPTPAGSLTRLRHLVHGTKEQHLTLRSEVQATLDELLRATRASRTTFRVDLPEENVAVAIPLAESLAPGVPTMMNDGSLDQRGTATGKWVDKHRKVLVQDDISVATDPQPPIELITVYGAKAQMLAPVEEDGALIGWVSVHYLPSPRKWTPEDAAAIGAAASRIQKALAERASLQR
jgi:maleate isomerase